jgi:hypothetical protein
LSAKFDRDLHPEFGSMVALSSRRHEISKRRSAQTPVAFVDNPAKIGRMIEGLLLTGHDG